MFLCSVTCFTTIYRYARVVALLFSDIFYDCVTIRNDSDMSSLRSCMYEIKFTGKRAKFGLFRERLGDSGEIIARRRMILGRHRERDKQFRERQVGCLAAPVVGLSFVGHRKSSQSARRIIYSAYVTSERGETGYNGCDPYIRNSGTGMIARGQECRTPPTVFVFARERRRAHIWIRLRRTFRNSVATNAAASDVIRDAQGDSMSFRTSCRVTSRTQ